jgi:hypothetical protein
LSKELNVSPFYWDFTIQTALVEGFDTYRSHLESVRVARGAEFAARPAVLWRQEEAPAQFAPAHALVAFLWEQLAE